jgi:hypothetical protein
MIDPDDADEPGEAAPIADASATATPVIESDDDCPLSDDELKAVLQTERKRSVGFDNDAELNADRKKALEYYKGEMEDVPSLPNRSKAVDSTTSDVIDALIPDLLEIFTGGDDVVTFKPRGPQDEDAAQQETDYVQKVVFEDNAGWLTLATAIKDALLCKIGVFAWWWENRPEDGWESFSGKTRGEVAAILQSQGGAMALVGAGRVKAMPSKDQGDGSEPLFDIEVQSEGPDGRACIAAWPSEDFTAAPDTVRLADTTYCAGRSRPRAQELKAQGYDPEQVDALSEIGRINEATALARDNAGEGEFQSGGSGNGDMRQVEVVDHFIRLLGKDNQLEIWRVKTGNDEALILRKERVERIGYDVITPDIAAHRLYGRSIADIVGELQRIKTALTRGWLDSIYFALNGRMYVDMEKTNEFTISDLLDNRPGMPVRGDGEGAVTPLSGSPIQSGMFSEGLEYFSVATEHRTGVMRNAQGLNPDTLHDTARGAQMLMAAAQKRVRMIARIFAETGVKGLYLGVHALLREHASKAAVAKLRGKWVDVDPTTWGSRDDMIVDVGLGSAGRAQDIAVLTQVLDIQERIVTSGVPEASQLVTATNVYNVVSDLVSKSGSKKGSMYFTDPSTVPPTPPQPHPDVVKAQIGAQADAAKTAADTQVKTQAAAQDVQLKTQVAYAQLNLKREQISQETALKQQEIEMQGRIEAMKAAMGAGSGGMPRVEYGGQPG